MGTMGSMESAFMKELCNLIDELLRSCSYIKLTKVQIFTDETLICLFLISTYPQHLHMKLKKH